jgi:cytoskeletal protein CcmA (bactofilin family)
MLGGRKSPFSVSGATTLISRDTVVVGDLHFSGNLDIEGLVRGNIIASEGEDALVRVVDKGCVEGEIRSPCVLINGEVKGDVHSSRHLELASRGRVQGNVFYTLLEMAAGSEVNGSLTHVADAVESAGSAVTTGESKEDEASRSTAAAPPARGPAAKVD